MLEKAFFKNSFITMSEQAFSSIASFITGIIVARSTNMQSMGSFALVLSISLVILGLQRVVVTIPFNVYYHKISDNNEKRNYISATTGIEAIFLLIIPVFAFGMFKLTAFAANINTFCIILFLIGYILKDYARQYFFCIEKIILCSCMSLVQSITQIIALTVLYNYNIKSISIFLLVVGISNIIFVLPFLAVNTYITLSRSQLSSAWNRNKFTVKWNIGISMSDSIKNQISVWLLNFFVSISAVGVFTNNNTLAMLPQPIFNGLSQYLLPHFSKLFAEKKYSQIKRNAMYAIMLLFLTNLLWIISLIFYGDKMIEVLYGREYITMTVVLVLFSFKGFLTSFSSITASILQAIEKPYSIAFSLLMAIISMCTIGAFLIWKYEILGMSLATVIMFLITLTIQVGAIRRATLIIK